MVTFFTRIPDCDSHSSALWDLFLLTLVFVLQWLSIHWEILIMLLSQFPLTFHRIHAPFHHITYEYSSADWDDLRHHLRDVPWEDIFKLGASVPASKFCEWVQVGIDIHICHRKYLVKPHSTPWFSTAGAAAIVHRNLCLKIYLFLFVPKGQIF